MAKRKPNAQRRFELVVADCKIQWGNSWGILGEHIQNEFVKSALFDYITVLYCFDDDSAEANKLIADRARAMHAEYSKYYLRNEPKPREITIVDSQGVVVSIATLHPDKDELILPG